MRIHHVQALVQHAHVMQHHRAVRGACGQQPLLHRVERNAVDLCSVRLTPFLGLRAPQAPDNELLVIATGPEDGGVTAVPRDILHHTRVAIERCGGLQSLRSSTRLSCSVHNAFIYSNTVQAALRQVNTATGKSPANPSVRYATVQQEDSVRCSS